MTDIIFHIGQKGSMKTISAVDQIIDEHKNGVEVFANIHIVGVNCSEIIYKTTYSQAGNRIRIAQYKNEDSVHFLSNPNQILETEFPENSILFTDEIHTWARNRRSMQNIDLADFALEVRHFDINSWLCTTPLGRTADIDLRDMVDYWVFCESVTFMKDDYGREYTVESRLTPIEERGMFDLRILESSIFDYDMFLATKDKYNTKEIVGINQRLPTNYDPKSVSDPMVNLITRENSQLAKGYGKI